LRVSAAQLNNRITLGMEALARHRRTTGEAAGQGLAERMGEPELGRPSPAGAEPLLRGIGRLLKSPAC
jgi:hypothetical protein